MALDSNLDAFSAPSAMSPCGLHRVLRAAATLRVTWTTFAGRWLIWKMSGWRIRLRHLGYQGKVAAEVDAAAYRVLSPFLTNDAVNASLPPAGLSRSAKECAHFSYLPTYLPTYPPDVKSKNGPPPRSCSDMKHWAMRSKGDRRP